MQIELHMTFSLVFQSDIATQSVVFIELMQLSGLVMSRIAFYRSGSKKSLSPTNCHVLKQKSCSY